LNAAEPIVVILYGKIIDVILLFSKELVPIVCRPDGNVNVVNELLENAESPMEVINGENMIDVSDLLLKTLFAIAVIGYVVVLYFMFIGMAR
jgi:hypothetical protein